MASLVIINPKKCINKECNKKILITKITKENDIINIRVFPGIYPLILDIQNNHINYTCHLGCTDDGELKEIISNMPIHKKLTEHISKIDIKCSTCQDNITEDKKYILLGCFHISCVKCIKEWNNYCKKTSLDQKTSCPDCRTILEHSEKPFDHIRLMSAPIANNEYSHLKKKFKTNHTEGLQRASSLNYASQTYEDDEGNSLPQEEIVQGLHNQENPFAKYELNFNQNVSRTERPIKIVLEDDEDKFPKKKLPQESEPFHSDKEILVKVITEKTGFNDLLAYVCDKDGGFEILNYKNIIYNKFGIQLKHSGDHIANYEYDKILHKRTNCLWHSCKISSDNYNMTVYPLNIPFVKNKTGYSDEKISSKIYEDKDKPEDLINNICKDIIKNLPKKEDKTIISTIFIIQSIFDRSNNVFIEEDKIIPSLSKLSPNMSPSCVILTKKKNNSTDELCIQPIVMNWSDEPAATIWAAIQVYK
jgi:hypothetical protein